MDSPFWFDTMNLGWFIVYIEDKQVIISNIIVFLSLNIVLGLVNNVVSDEILHHVAFYLGIHCLPVCRYPE